MVRILGAAYTVTMAAGLMWWTAESTPALQPGYDWSNRALVVPLALLTCLFVALRRLVRLRAATVAAVGAGLMTGGIVVEFWFGMLQSAPLSGDAHRLNLPESSIWIGSDLGFYLYGLGLLVVTVATVVLGVLILRRGAADALTAVGVLAAGPLQVAAFVTKEMSVPAAAIIAVLILLSGLMMSGAGFRRENESTADAAA